MGAGRSGTSASSSGSKKNDAEGKGGASAGGNSSSGGKSPSGGGTGARGPTGAGGTASHTGAKGPAGAPSRSPSPSSPKSGPGGAGGVRNTSQGTRQSQPAARVGSSGGTILSNPSRAAQSMGGLLNGLNRRDRDVVEAGTRFGNRLGLDTGYGISFMDPTRFSGFRPNTNLAQVNPGALTRLVNAQLAFGKPLQVNAGYALTGHQKKGAHPKGLAIDVQVPTPADRFDFVRAATQAGFTHTGTYGHGLKGVHVDTRPGMGDWGPNLHSTSTPPEQKAAIAEGLRTPANWGSIAANIAGQRVAPGLAPSLSNAVRTANVDPRARALPQPKPAEIAMRGITNSFPSRPGVPGAFPAEDRVPSTFPGRPETVGAFPSARPQSTFPGRPEMPGALPAEDARPSSFPGRPGLPSGFQSQIAGRPAPQPDFVSRVAGRPEFPGSFPASRPTSSFPARPEFAGSFPGEDRVPSSFPSRPEFRGSFPAAETSPQVASTFPGRPEMPGSFPAAQEKPGLFASLGEAVKEAVQAPAKKIGDLANLAWDNINNPDLSFVTPRQPGNPLMGGGDGRGTTGSTNVWTGREPPQAVAQMQQHVEQVLRAYLLQMQNAA
jgi:hypothetical protein